MPAVDPSTVVQAFYADTEEGSALAIRSNLPALEGSYITVRGNAWLVYETRKMMPPTKPVASIPVGDYVSLAHRIAAVLRFYGSGQLAYTAHADPNAVAPQPPLVAVFSVAPECGMNLIIIVGAVLIAAAIATCIAMRA